MDIDDLRKLCTRPDMTDDEAMLEFYCWQDALQWVEAWRDDSLRGVESTLQSWFLNGIKPATITEVKAWLADFFNPDAIGGTDKDMLHLIDSWRLSR